MLNGREIYYDRGWRDAETKELILTNEAQATLLTQERIALALERIAELITPKVPEQAKDIETK
jgi:hypothetical protein